jgi:hypothetical protein
MNKKDKNDLCMYYEMLHDSVNKIGHELLFRRTTLEHYHEARKDVHKKVSETKDIIDKMFEHFDLENTYHSEDFGESHLGCPSYPNCDLDPNGCRQISGDDVEYYGHRD